MEQVMIPRQSLDVLESLTAEDFETASVRSAAPSYRSEAPTLHYTVPSSGGSLLPPYTAPPVGSAERVTAPSGAGRHRSVPSLSGGRSSAAASRRTASSSAASGAGAAAAFASPLLSQRGGDLPNLTQFRIPSWSTISSSPNARLYHSVALRRVAAAEHASAAAEIGGLMRRLAVLERMEQEEAAASRRMAAASSNRTAAASNGSGSSGRSGSGSGGNSSRAGSGSRNTSANQGSNDSNYLASSGAFRPLEDPYLVGEAAARRARAERIARENRPHADEALVREDRRWDWFLGQTRNRPSSGLRLSQSRIRRHVDVGMLSPSSLLHARTRRV